MIKSFKLFETQTYDDFRELCKLYSIKGNFTKWTMNPETGLVDMNGSVNFTNLPITNLPIKFGNVANFYCVATDLTFYCEGNPSMRFFLFFLKI